MVKRSAVAVATAALAAACLAALVAVQHRVSPSALLQQAGGQSLHGYPGGYSYPYGGYPYPDYYPAAFAYGGSYPFPYADGNQYPDGGQYGYDDDAMYQQYVAAEQYRQWQQYAQEAEYFDYARQQQYYDSVNQAYYKGPEGGSTLKSSPRKGMNMLKAAEGQMK
ncbi:hypothetical protein T484DRAFT_1777395, partial [Baffinella frigidus]